MPLSAPAQNAKDRLDAQLGSSGLPINVKMGVSLYNELCDAKQIRYELWDPIVFRTPFAFPSYGPGRFVFYDVDLGPFDFVVGDGGIKV